MTGLSGPIISASLITPEGTPNHLEPRLIEGKPIEISKTFGPYFPNILINKATRTVGFKISQGTSFTAFSDNFSPLLNIDLLNSMEYVFGEELIDADYNGSVHILLAFYH